MKKILFIIIASLFLTNCGSVKKDKTSIDTEKENELNAGSNTARWINSNNWGLEPVDLSQPMIFTNSKGETETYTNTKVYHNNTHTKEIIHDTIKVAEKEKTSVDEKHKETDNTMLIIGIVVAVLVFFLIVIIFIVWYFSKQFTATSKQITTILSSIQK